MVNEIKFSLSKEIRSVQSSNSWKVICPSAGESADEVGRRPMGSAVGSKIEHWSR